MSLLKKYKYQVNGYFLSIVLHFLLFCLVVFYANFSATMVPYGKPFGKKGAGPKGGNLIEAGVLKENSSSQTLNPLEKVKKQSGIVEKINDKLKPGQKLAPQQKKQTEINPNFDASLSNSIGSGNGFDKYGEGYGDTTGLANVYSENTLNVFIRYPAGWVYTDQDRKNKLDGISFWAENYPLNPPPYIHFEVQDKDYFDARKWKYKLEMSDFEMYYNDPQVLQGEVSQVVYLKTSVSEDYTISVTVRGETEFKAFQPVFFGMIQSFKFGHKFLF